MGCKFSRPPIPGYKQERTGTTSDNAPFSYPDVRVRGYLRTFYVLISFLFFFSLMSNFFRFGFEFGFWVWVGFTQHPFLR